MESGSAIRKVRGLSLQLSQNKAPRSRIKPDRAKTKKAGDPDQVREKTLLSKNPLPK